MVLDYRDMSLSNDQLRALAGVFLRWCRLGSSRGWRPEYQQVNGLRMAMGVAQLRMRRPWR